MNITLKLWVSNQPNDSDCTDEYLMMAVTSGWIAPCGVTLDLTGATIRGDDPEVVWRAFCLLADAVAEVGHGDDVGEDAGRPCLTACPEWLEGAAKSLARKESTCHETWAEFVAAVPALREARQSQESREEYGDLHDYHSGEYLRPATLPERDESRAAGPEGVILVRGRRCYVQE